MAATNYPIGFWNYVSAERQGPEAVRDWADCGMTLAMGPEYSPGSEAARENMHGILQEAASHGIRVIHCHADTTWRSMTAHGRDEYRRRAEVAVAEFGGYGSLMGFHVGDEPDLFRKIDYPDVVASFQVLNEIAPRHHHFSNFLPWWLGIEREIYCPESTYEEHLEKYVTEGGIRQLCYDCYAQMKPAQHGWDQFFRNLRFYRELGRRLNVPVWTTLLSAGHYDYKAPNEHEYRWQLHAAAAHGMQGVLWFVFYLREGGGDYHGAPVDEHWERSQSFEWLSRVNRTFNKSVGPKLMELSHVETRHAGRSFGGWPSLAAGDDIVRAVFAQTPFIYSRFTAPGGVPYILLMNNSPDTATHAYLRISSAVKSLHRVAWEGEEREEAFDARYDAFSEFGKWFMPAQLELYRVSLVR